MTLKWNTTLGEMWHWNETQPKEECDIEWAESGRVLSEIIMK